ncbi:MAG: hypothetical protein KGQ60_07785 [Planctomycetes bacterium]|nr:hypothetical protein [Planctomycetota bacterium]
MGNTTHIGGSEAATDGMLTMIAESTGDWTGGIESKHDHKQAARTVKSRRRFTNLSSHSTYGAIRQWIPRIPTRP